MKPQSQPEASLTVGQAARRLGVTRARIYQLLGEDAFPRATRYGETDRLWQIPEGDVEAHKARTAKTEAGE